MQERGQSNTLWQSHVPQIKNRVNRRHTQINLDAAARWYPGIDLGMRKDDRKLCRQHLCRDVLL